MNNMLLRLINLLALSSATFAADAENFNIHAINNLVRSPFIFNMPSSGAPPHDYFMFRQSMYYRALAGEIRYNERKLIKLLHKTEPFYLFKKKYQYLGYIYCSDEKYIITYFLREIKTDMVIAVESNNPSDKLLFTLAELFEAELAEKNTYRQIDRNNFTSNPLGIIPQNLCGSQKQEDYDLAKQQIIDILCSHFLIIDEVD